MLCFWLALLIILRWTVPSVESVEQHFIVVPRQTETSVGETVTLRCQVANRAGDVQWSKDGFLLGFEATIPGFARYSMDVRESQGIYDLIIKDVHLSDEGEYQCQVGPAPEQQPIRAGAKLTVMLAPSSVILNNKEKPQEIQVREATRITISCQTDRSKPKATLKWYKNRKEIEPDEETKPSETTAPASQCSSCFITIGTLSVHPKREDSDATYTCSAQHPALKAALEASLTISVLYAPDPPTIEGYTEDDSLKVGDQVSLVCVSRSGNPPARLTWFRGNAQVDASYTTAGKVTSNKYTWTVRPRDNKSLLRCEASNDVSVRAASTSVQLNVVYAPASVRVTGPKSAISGETVTLTCTTDPSNPPALITWSVDGGSVLPGDEMSYGTETGWVTVSNLTVTLGRQEPEVKTFTCETETPPFPHAVTETAKMTVYTPPAAPTILGMRDATRPLREGELYRFVCVALGGHPRATLRWFKRDREIRTLATTSGSGVSSELVIRAEADDHNALYRCEAENVATSRPYALLMKLTVLYGPDHVIMEADPQPARSGTTVLISCKASPSNPEPKYSWLKNRVESISGQRSVIGGSRLHLRVTSKEDGAVISCVALNEPLGKSVRGNFTLRVLYKPDFSSHVTRVDVVERDTTLVNVTASANPSEVTYRWTRRGTSVPTARDRKRLSENSSGGSVEAEGPVLYVTGATRSDAGNYFLEAENSQGKTNATVVLNVLYGASITNLTRQLEVHEGDEARLECLFDANPSSASVVRWRRKGNGDQRLPSDNSAGVGRSELILRQVAREDAGFYECVAFNGIGRPEAAECQLIITYKPVILSTFTSRSVGGQLRDDVSLRCLADASPGATFQWSFEGSPIEAAFQRGAATGTEAFGPPYVIGGATGTLGTGSKFLVRNMRTEDRVWESVLYIRDLETADFGNYTCLSRNEFGYDSIDIWLVKQRKPDPPMNLKLTNVTGTSVVLTWEPGFDGGSTQTFRVRYSKLGETHYVYEKVSDGRSQCQVTGLEAGSAYVFSAASANALGESAFSDHIVRAAATHTQVGASSTSFDASPAPPDQKRVPPDNKKKTGATGSGAPRHQWWLTTAVVGGVLVALNLTVIICLVTRKKRKKRKAYKMARQALGSGIHGPSPGADGVACLLQGSAGERSLSSRRDSEDIDIELRQIRLLNAEIVERRDRRKEGLHHLMRRDTLDHPDSETKSWPDVIAAGGEYIGPTALSVKASMALEEMMPSLEEAVTCHELTTFIGSKLDGDVIQA